MRYSYSHLHTVITVEVTMFDQETKEILMTTESEILTLNLQDALGLAKDLKIDYSKVKDKSKFSIIKIVRQEMEEKVGNLSQKKEIIEYLNRFPWSTPSGTA